MKNFFTIFLVLAATVPVWAQKNSFDKIIGKTAVNLEPGSFRFSLGVEGRNDKWGNGDYSSLIVPIHTSLGLFDNVEVDVGAEYSKAYTFIDEVAVREKYSYHNLYGGVRLMMNPHQVHEKPAYGFWLGMYVPLHEYKAWKPEAIFLWSSYIKDVFSWNFNLGWAYYLNRMDYQIPYEGKIQNQVAGGMEISPKIEIGYIFSDLLKMATGFDVRIHFLSKRFFADGSHKSVEDFSSFKWISALRFKPGNLPVVIDGGVRVGLNRQADESLSFFLQIQLIPDSSDAVW